ncbi:MAG TPA: DUF2059 domain-containing protein [Candidatus Omnitrophota bacterium]|mgnify:CR=1 FL=1|nr:DUF2059 domain-containing protein [Candidatus Omnitrophota bacterium]HQL40801.1 DUF2059 domain-containing protein [Candidatus Omnitrophota bacterium]
MKNILMIVCFLLAASSHAFADTVYLKSGRVVEGNIIERSDRQIKIDVNGMTLTYYMDEVDRVDSAQGAPASQAVLGQDERIATMPSQGNIYSALSKEGLVLKYMEVTGVKSNMQKTFADIVDAAPEEKKADLRQVLNLDEVLRQLAPVYEQYFSERDLQELIAFYESDVGRKLLRTAPLILKDSMDKSLEYFQGKLD